MLRSAAAISHSTGMLSLLRRFEGVLQLSSTPKSLWPKFHSFKGSKHGILCYHRVGTQGTPLFSKLQPRVFAAQMKYIRAHYRVVPLGQMCREIKNNDIVEPSLAVTFDDGYRDLYTHALPTLKQYQIPATVYLIGQSMETGESPWYDRIFVALDNFSCSVLQLDLDVPREFALPTIAARRNAAWEIVCYLRTIPDVQRRKWCADFDSRMKPPAAQLENRMLDWKYIREMQGAGIFFGAHTMTHPSMAKVEASRFDEELVASRKLLEAGLDAPIEDFAYPFGKAEDCLPPHDSVLPEAGYRSAVTTIQGINSTKANLFRMNRMQINDDRSLSLFAFNLARTFFEGPEESLPIEVEPRHIPLRADRRAS
jgi:peptidoglycan/xylan/chitin deacetylase (PgdA/CDA1 family)